MRKSFSLLGALMIAAALSTPALAGHGKGKGGGGGGGGGEPQAGGLPGLEDRVEADEALIAALQKTLGTLQAEVTALQGQVADLQGQNNWAVVQADGTLVRSLSSAGAISVDHTASSGQYEVTFAKDMSGCAYEATIGDTATAVPTQGQISVSGDTDSDNPNDVFVQTFDKTGATATDMPFHLYVSCP